jgi:hypothetical protein
MYFPSGTILRVKVGTAVVAADGYGPLYMPVSMDVNVELKRDEAISADGRIINDFPVIVRSTAWLGDAVNGRRCDDGNEFVVTARGALYDVIDGAPVADPGSDEPPLFVPCPAGYYRYYRDAAGNCTPLTSPVPVDPVLPLVDPVPPVVPVVWYKRPVTLIVGGLLVVGAVVAVAVRSRR